MAPSAGWTRNHPVIVRCRADTLGKDDGKKTGRWCDRHVPVSASNVDPGGHGCRLCAWAAWYGSANICRPVRPFGRLIATSSCACAGFPAANPSGQRALILCCCPGARTRILRPTAKRPVRTMRPPRPFMARSSPQKRTVRAWCSMLPPSDKRAGWGIAVGPAWAWVRRVPTSLCSTQVDT